MTTNALVWFLICLFFLGVGGANFAMYTLWLPEQYSTECRASAFAFATSIGRFVGAGITFLVGYGVFLLPHDWNSSSADCIGSLCWEYFYCLWSGDEREELTRIARLLGVRWPGTALLKNLCCDGDRIPKRCRATALQGETH